MILHDFKICNSGLKNPKLLSILLMWFAFLLSNAWWCGGVVVWLCGCILQALSLARKSFNICCRGQV